ncbi:MAG: helix-turn-helix domain-containing protein [Bdellovibrionales bacterium]|nr:helix-turn-helix domain-containing protein [Bdellovibrionales bacterium]
MNQRFLDQTYYEILEVAPHATEDEIHRAYIKAKDTYSPDSPALYTMFSPDEAQELSRLIEEAYSVLSNHAARREYDSRLLGRQPKPEPNRVNMNSASVQLSSPPQRQKNIESVPAGFAKTKFGIYEVKQEFENEIKSLEEFSGEHLAQMRTYKNITLEDLSDDIRVSRSYLRAIEASEYSALPADVFVRGFVLQYAKALGLNAEKVASSYMKILRDARSK